MSAVLGAASASLIVLVPLLAGASPVAADERFRRPSFHIGERYSYDAVVEDGEDVTRQAGFLNVTVSGPRTVLLVDRSEVPVLELVTDRGVAFWEGGIATPEGQVARERIVEWYHLSGGASVYRARFEDRVASDDSGLHGHVPFEAWFDAGSAPTPDFAELWRQDLRLDRDAGHRVWQGEPVVLAHESVQEVPDPTQVACSTAAPSVPYRGGPIDAAKAVTAAGLGSLGSAWPRGVARLGAVCLALTMMFFMVAHASTGLKVGSTIALLVGLTGAGLLVVRGGHLVRVVGATAE